MRSLRVLGMSLLLIVLLVLACAPQATPAPQTPAVAQAAAAPAQAAPAAKPPVRQAWEAEWENTLAAARTEGKVQIHTTAGGALRDAIMKIARMQGIEAEVLSARTAEFLVKAQAERRAGLSLHDIYLGGAGPPINTAKPAGMLQSIDSALILPDVTDPQRIKQVWFEGKLPWVDKDHTVFAIALQPGTAITINTSLVKEGEVKSWRDLLDPKWSGKVGYNDPTVAGYGSLSVQVMLVLMGEDYPRELVKAKPIIIRDQRQLVDWLAHAKLAIAIAAPVEILVEFMQAGAPIKSVMPQEGTWLGPGNAGTLFWFKNPPHPNASKVFINMLTSKEGQDIFAPTGGLHSTREDASTAHLLPGLARTPGAKYFPSQTEENVLNRGQVTDKLARDLFGPLVK